MPDLGAEVAHRSTEGVAEHEERKYRLPIGIGKPASRTESPRQATRSAVVHGAVIVEVQVEGILNLVRR